MAQRGELADPSDYGDILSTADVAEILGITVATAQRYMREGTIPAHRFRDGRRFYVLKDELLEALRAQPADHDADQQTSPSDD